MSPYIRTVRTTSGVSAVQIVHSEKRGAKDLNHLGSVHTPEGLAALKLQAQQLIDGEQPTLDLGVDTTPASTGAHRCRSSVNEPAT